MKKSLVKESLKRGFTLVELLVVVAILGILGTIAIQNVTEYFARTNENAARTAVNTIRDTINNNYTQGVPSNLDLHKLIEDRPNKGPMLEGGEGAIEDPWGNEYKYEKKNGRPVIISAGPDGEFGTEDDIRSDVTKKKEK